LLLSPSPSPLLKNDTKTFKKKYVLLEIKTRRLSDHIFQGNTILSKGRGMTLARRASINTAMDIRNIDWKCYGIVIMRARKVKVF
jgi:hypothetical protein